MAKARRRFDPASTKRVPKNQENETRKSEKMGRTADFSGVGEYPTIAAGTYEAEATGHEWKDPKEDGKPRDIDPDTGKPYQYASVKWVVQEETDAEGNRVQGHVLYNTYSKNPKSLFIMKRDAISLGEDPEIFEGENAKKVNIDQIVENMMGRSALLTVGVRSFTRPDGTVRKSNDVTKVEPLSNVPTGVSARR